MPPITTQSLTPNPAISAAAQQRRAVDGALDDLLPPRSHPPPSPAKEETNAANPNGEEAMIHISEQTIREMLECPLCFSLFRSPITTHCGHSFCGSCLQRALKQVAACPLCRAPCHIDSGFGTRSSTNVLLERLLTTLLPEASQAEEADDANAFLSRRNGLHEPAGGQLGMFVLDESYFGVPGSSVLLRVFEPRYLLLVSRCLSEGCRFGILAGWSARRGVVVRVDRAREVSSRLQILVEGTIESRFEIPADQTLHEEPGTGGLFYAQARVVKDVPSQRDDDVAPLMARAQVQISMLLAQLKQADRQHVESIAGPRPMSNDAMDFSFWLMSLLAWPSPAMRTDVLFDPSCASRLRQCIRVMEITQSSAEAYFDALAQRKRAAFGDTAPTVFFFVAIAFIVLLGFD